MNDLTVHDCITLCIACDIANYKPPLFEEFLIPTLSNMNFHQQFDIKINWPKFALQLHRFGIYHHALIDAILKQKSDFQSIDRNSVAELETIKMEKLLCTQVGNSLEELKGLMEENRMQLLAHANNDMTIPIVVKIDVHSKQFVPFCSTETGSIYSYKCEQNQCL